jgi:hypothetical protein
MHLISSFLLYFIKKYLSPFLLERSIRMRSCYILILSFLFFQILACPKVEKLFWKILITDDLIDINHFEIQVIYCQLQLYYVR